MRERAACYFSRRSHAGFLRGKFAALCAGVSSRIFCALPQAGYVDSLTHRAQNFHVT
jgi:hypothetical protein